MIIFFIYITSYHRIHNRIIAQLDGIALQKNAQFHQGSHFNKQILMENYKLSQVQAQDILLQANYKMNKANSIILGKQKYLPPGLNRREKKNNPSLQQHVQTKQEEKKQALLKIQNKNYKNKQQNEALKVHIERQEKLKMNAQFRKVYMVKRPLHKKKFYNNRQNKLEQQKEFVPQFQFYLGRISSINFVQQLNDVFETLLQTKKFIAIHVINMSQNIVRDTFKFSNSQFQKTLTTKVLKDFYFNRKITKVFNKEFINYGMDPQTFDFGLYPFMRQFVHAQNDKCCVNILKYSERTQRIALGLKMTIFQFLTSKDTKDTHQFGKKILILKKRVQKLCEERQLAGQKVKQEFIQQKFSPFQEDKEIIKNQDIQYERMKQLNKQQNRKLRQQRIKNGQESQEEMQKMKQEVIKSVHENILLQRQQLRKKLPIYKNQGDPMKFKLRCPNGKLLNVLVSKFQKVKYLYNYVLSLQDIQLGFRNDFYRIFELIQPLQDLNLEAKKQQKISQIFKNSLGQLLIIKETTT